MGETDRQRDREREHVENAGTLGEGILRNLVGGACRGLPRKRKNIFLILVPYLLRLKKVIFASKGETFSIILYIQLFLKTILKNTSLKQTRYQKYSMKIQPKLDIVAQET